MPDTNPNESLDAEGMPEIQGRAPGIDVELDEEAMVAPRDYPIAAGADPAYANTAAEQASPEMALPAEEAAMGIVSDQDIR